MNRLMFPRGCKPVGMPAPAARAAVKAPASSRLAAPKAAKDGAAQAPSAEATPSPAPKTGDGGDEWESF